MAISQQNKRVVGTVTNEEYELIENLAKEQSRTVSNMVTKLIRDGLEINKQEAK